MEDRVSYVESLFAAEDEVLRNVRASIAKHGMPDIAVKPAMGKLLTLLARLSGASRILEIGALAGYSGVCLARGLGPGGLLTSLELNPDYAQVAQQNLAAAGFADRVRYMTGPALASLEQLAAAGETFDFFFIDADKGNYPAYLDWAIRLARPGALITADNVLLGGRVAQPENQDSPVVAMREFNRRLTEDERLESIIIPWYDGLAVARVKA